MEKIVEAGVPAPLKFSKPVGPNSFNDNLDETTEKDLDLFNYLIPSSI